MSTYHDSAARTGASPTGAPAKPITVTLTMWLSLAVGVLGLASGIIMITGGRESIRKFVEATFGGMLGSDASADLINSAIASELDDAYHKLVLKAAIGIAASLLITLFAVLARNAASGPRIGLVIALVIGMGAASLLQLGDREVLPSPSVLIAAVTPLLSLIAIILAFLPATKRYATARKAA